MTAQACRTTFGNYINCIRCVSRLLDTHTPTWSSSRDYISFSFTDLFAKLRWPGERKMTIRSSSRCHLPPMLTTPRLILHSVPLTINVKQGSCEYQFLKYFDLARPGNEPRSTDCKEDALTATPSLLPRHNHSPIKRSKTCKPQCPNIDKKKRLS